MKNCTSFYLAVCRQNSAVFNRNLAPLDFFQIIWFLWVFCTFLLILIVSTGLYKIRSLLIYFGPYLGAKMSDFIEKVIFFKLIFFVSTLIFLHHEPEKCVSTYFWIILCNIFTFSRCWIVVVVISCTVPLGPQSATAIVALLQLSLPSLLFPI